MVDLSTINHGEDRIRAETDEVVINGYRIPAASVTTSLTSRFESKLTFGDYSKDSDQLQSTWIQSNLAGGMLINNHIEGATDQRGRWANAWTMSSEQLALPPKHSVLEFGPEIESTDADARGPISMPLIEVLGVLYVAMGKELWKISASTYEYTDLDWEKVDDLPGYAVGPAVMGSDNRHFLIPLGEKGWVSYRSHLHETDPDDRIGYDATRKLIAVKWWDRKIIGLDTEGQVLVYHPGVEAEWDPANDNMKLPSDEQPRGLEVFYDQGGEQAIFIVSDRRLWALDYETSNIYPSTLSWPKHHNNGLGFTSWRDDALYISSGLAVTRYTRDGVRTDVGLDRDDGIPTERVLPMWGTYYNATSPAINVLRPSRSITSMVGTQNFIAATVQLGGRTEDEETDYCPYAVAAWNESGWHILVEESLPYQEGTGAGRYPTGMMVTENVGGYRLWWGEGAVEHQGSVDSSAYVGTPRIHSIPIPRAFHGPRQNVLDNVEDFATHGYYETGWFDAGMTGFLKTWSHLEVNLSNPANKEILNGSVSVEYRTDRNPNTWVPMGTITDFGRNVLKFNVDGKGKPVGDTSYRIELRFEMQTSIPSESPIIDSFVLKFIKLALPGNAWQIAVPLDSENHAGIGPNEITDILARQTYQGGFSFLIHKDKEYRCRISQVQHVEASGDIPYKSLQINMIEVPIPGDPMWGGDR